MGTLRFASAMAMAMASGLDAETSIDMAGRVSGGAKKMDEKVADCKRRLEDGARLEEALSGAGIFSGRDSRMLSLGVKAGSGDSVMQEIARRNEEEVQDSLDSLLGKVEPTLVVFISVVVGAILLSVMLPLMGILSSIG